MEPVDGQLLVRACEKRAVQCWGFLAGVLNNWNRVLGPIIL